MKRSVRSLLCAMLFLLLTAFKLVAPAAASDFKSFVLPILDRNDDLESILYRVEQEVLPRQTATGIFVPPVSPLERIQSVLDAKPSFPMVEQAIPLPSPEPELENNLSDAALEYGFQAREAFLSQQAEVCDQLPPDNVSYDVMSLPFSTTSPVAGYTSSGFGYRMHPIHDELRFHYGTDFAADEGTEIVSFADGIVLAFGTDEGYGNYVKVDHGDGFVTLYGHCSELLVSEGESVSKGQCIALVGSTGQATGPHLHFELIHHGVYLNPEFYLYA